MTRFVDRRTDRPVVGVGIGEPAVQPDLSDPTSAHEEAQRSGVSAVLGDPTDVRFVEEGGDDAPGEGAFFPGDTYVVSLQRGSERWTYRISASGEILSFATAASART